MFDHWETVPSEFRTFAISKLFMTHVRITSLRGEISHVSVVSWYRGPIGVDCSLKRIALGVFLHGLHRFSFLLLLRPHGAKIISSVRGYIRQTGSAKLDRPISAELLVVNRRFLSQFRVPGETGSAKLALPILLLPKGGWSFLKARGKLHRLTVVPTAAAPWYMLWSWRSSSDLPGCSGASWN